MDVKEMKAGRELDALVAVKVLGWRKCTLAENKYAIIPPLGDDKINWGAIWDEYGCPSYMPDYSEKISAAWEVVKKINSEYWVQIQQGRNGASVEVGKFGHSLSSIRVSDETAPEAICKAALLTMEDKQ